VFGRLLSTMLTVVIDSPESCATSASVGRVPFARFLANSVIISVATVVLGLLVNSMAAFALSRIQFRGQKAILGVVLATLIVPFETLARHRLLQANEHLVGADHGIYASIIIVPVLAMFIAHQRAFINSIAASGVKG